MKFRFETSNSKLAAAVALLVEGFDEKKDPSISSLNPSKTQKSAPSSAPPSSAPPSSPKKASFPEEKKEGPPAMETASPQEETALTRADVSAALSAAIGRKVSLSRIQEINMELCGSVKTSDLRPGDFGAAIAAYNAENNS